ncbi:hypothetical protein HD553DRAFT_305175 [Filobasidium floriforme]|uniref:uncharacterized protein n=1 Tax=Filobasidium floriforme TaxID=5210 RepID=UPI001E8CC1F2|nr:uncharacterized protein HD553DRAFT_305175 [Filobasidium floriforme]KAH8089110.1 hypothetical protein HD553DRAFT_305175 [Filobasidium floriforme]
MFSLRTVARTQVRSLRVAPAMSARGYADNAGNAASSGGGDSFKNKEQAEEAVYFRKQEALKLAKAKESLAKNEDERKRLEKELKNLEAKSA